MPRYKKNKMRINGRWAKADETFLVALFGGDIGLGALYGGIAGGAFAT